jgi:predicted DNA-binding helix-hairpin-helix protein
MMDVLAKIDILGEAATWDTERGCSPRGGRVAAGLDKWIFPAVRPDGKRIRMLKVLQSNTCENNCAYCAFRRDRDVRRTAFQPDELARMFADLVRMGKVEGLFLSSGVCGNAIAATERMLATADLVRRRHGFRGYLHLKILPGADLASIEESVRLASRVSTNLEAPNEARVARLSPNKRFDDLLGYLSVTDRIRREAPPWVSMTTQFVVGAADESDAELLDTTAHLYRDLGLARAYYSAFQPVPGTPLEGHAATPLLREHRLYQADFLLHDYGFRFDELVFDGTGGLPMHADPKTLWARQHPEVFPVELNAAGTRELMRVPGIGRKIAEQIVSRRALGRLRELGHIALKGKLASRVGPYVLLDGRVPTYQPGLWPIDEQDNTPSA